MTTLPGNHSDAESDSLLKKLSHLFQVVQQKAVAARATLHFSDADAQCSCDNLLAYLALREHDLQDLQLELAERGLSSLGRLEGSVLHSLRKVMGHLGIEPPGTPLMAPDFAQAASILSRRSTLLLGRPRPHHRTRIMVTLDPDVVRQPDLLEQLLLKGMDIARVNCAHDTSREWSMIITALRDAEKRLASRGQAIGRMCRIFMDLAGPKVRTGPLTLTTRPLKLTVEKDAYGRPSRMLEGILDTNASQSQRIRSPGIPPSFVIALPGHGSLANLVLSEELRFMDTRGRRRAFRVLEQISPTKVRVGLERTAYLNEGMGLVTDGGIRYRIGPIMHNRWTFVFRQGTAYSSTGIRPVSATRRKEDSRPASVAPFPPCWSRYNLDIASVSMTAGSRPSSGLCTRNMWNSKSLLRMISPPASARRRA